MSALLHLSDNQLIDVYDKAIKSGLEKEFIRILDEELKRRGLEDKIIC